MLIESYVIEIFFKFIKTVFFSLINTIDNITLSMSIVS